MTRDNKTNLAKERIVELGGLALGPFGRTNSNYVKEIWSS